MIHQYTQDDVKQQIENAEIPGMVIYDTVREAKLGLLDEGRHNGKLVSYNSGIIL